MTVYQAERAWFSLGKMAYGAGAAGAGYMYQICDKLTEAVVTFVNSIHFNKEEVKEETKRSQLNLTQAYALLWQESKDREVNGAMELRAVLYVRHWSI